MSDSNLSISMGTLYTTISFLLIGKSLSSILITLEMWDTIDKKKTLRKVAYVLSIPWISAKANLANGGKLHFPTDSTSLRLYPILELEKKIKKFQLVTVISNYIWNNTSFILISLTWKYLFSNVFLCYLYTILFFRWNMQTWECDSKQGVKNESYKW